MKPGSILEPRTAVKSEMKSGPKSAPMPIATRHSAKAMGRLWEVSKSNLERMVRALENEKFGRKLLVWIIKVYPIWDAATPGGLI